jgi:hypothetical protein
VRDAIRSIRRRVLRLITALRRDGLRSVLARVRRPAEPDDF